MRIKSVIVKWEIDQINGAERLGMYTDDPTGAIDRLAIKFQFRKGKKFDPLAYEKARDSMRGQYRYFRPNLCTAAELENDPEMRRYAYEDLARADKYNDGQLWDYGCQAVAVILMQGGMGTGDSIMQTIHSGGSGGIECDSDKDYFAEVEREELATLTLLLRELRFTDAEINTAMSAVKYEGRP